MKRPNRTKRLRGNKPARRLNAVVGGLKELNGSLKSAWLPWISAAVHVTLAILIGGSVLILLMEHSQSEGDVGLIGGWTKTAGSVIESLGMERRRPYVLAMLGAFALPPLAAGWWDGRCLMHQLGGCDMRLLAPLAALLCVVLYAATVQVLTQNSTGYITIMARSHIWFSHVLVGFYGLLYIPIAIVAAHLVRRWQYGGRT